MIASPTRDQVSLRADAAGAAIYVHVALTCTATLCGTPWGLLASLHWGLTLPQGRCGRWLLLLGILPVQVAGGGSKDRWCKKMTVDGVDTQLHCAVYAFVRQGCVLKLLHGDIDMDVAAAF